MSRRVKREFIPIVVLNVAEILLKIYIGIILYGNSLAKL
jgi:hypothetical protein